jgi:hypothetical protein
MESAYIGIRGLSAKRYNTYASFYRELIDCGIYSYFKYFTGLNNGVIRVVGSSFNYCLLSNFSLWYLGDTFRYCNNSMGYAMNMPNGILLVRVI